MLGGALTFPRDRAANYQNKRDIAGGGTRWVVLAVAVRGKVSVVLAMIPCCAFAAAQEPVRAREKVCTPSHDASWGKERERKKACTP
jgi:hypothetical protein